MQKDYVELVDPIETRRWLGCSSAVFSAISRSGLLGRITTDNDLLWEDVRHYQTFGTQWPTADRPDLPPARMLSADFIQNMPPPPDIGDEKYAGVQAWFYICREDVGMPDVEDAMETDTGWLAHFYLTPNPYMWPAPTSMGMIGPTLLKLRRRRIVLGSRPRTELCPDPSGALALVTVFQPRGRLKESFEAAYDTAGPVLDELSVKYDLPLPVSHSAVVGIPSGLTITHFSTSPEIRTLEIGDQLLPGNPHPELKHAVSLYREGISSNSPFHQFLTLWKVYENAFEVRGKWRRQHKRHVVKVREEIIPEAFAFGSHQGKTFEKVRQELNDPFRVALAHGGNLKTGGGPKTAASAEDYLSVVYAVPVVRHIAHVTLQNVRATLDSTERSSA